MNVLIMRKKLVLFSLIAIISLFGFNSFFGYSSSVSQKIRYFFIPNSYEITSIESNEMVTGQDDLAKFTNSRAELELTKNVTIMPKDCKHFQRISVYILSSVNSYERRELLRKTWISDVIANNISVYFVIALTNNQTDEQLIREESEKYGDLIQFGFIDTYNNLTLKSVSILRWSEKYCKTEYILKTDDDIIVNIELLLKNLDKFKQGIHGVLNTLALPNLNPKKKWYMPNNIYSKKYYPQYIGGGAYLISGFKVNPLLKVIDEYNGYVIKMEDVFITGIIAERAEVARYSLSLLNPSCSNKCYLNKLAIITKCQTLLELKQRWLELKNSQDLCESQTEP